VSSAVLRLRDRYDGAYIFLILPITLERKLHSGLHFLDHPVTAVSGETVVMDNPEI
jgi:hypothetical protein